MAPHQNCPPSLSLCLGPFTKVAQDYLLKFKIYKMLLEAILKPNFCWVKTIFFKLSRHCILTHRAPIKADLSRYVCTQPRHCVPPCVHANQKMSHWVFFHFFPINSDILAVCKLIDGHACATCWSAGTSLLSPYQYFPQSVKIRDTKNTNVFLDSWPHQ